MTANIIPRTTPLLCDIAQPSILRNGKCSVENQLLTLQYNNNCSIDIVFIQESTALDL